jgi:hypothetical protein
MLEEAVSKASSHTLEFFDVIVESITRAHSEIHYRQDYHPYIVKNDELEKYIQSHFSLNKKLFNAIQKSKVHSLHLITEAWCLDACILLPLLRGIQIIKPEIEIKIHQRDENEELMNLFLTNGSKSIPIVFGLNDKQKELFRWGPRSKKAREILEPVKDEKYDIKSKALSDFYKTDLTESIQLEWIDLIK